MTIDEINKIKLNEMNILDILQRLSDKMQPPKTIPQGELWYITIDNPELPVEEKYLLSYEESTYIPQDTLDEFEAYKNELYAAEYARLEELAIAEENRVKALRDRWKNVKNKRMGVYKLGLDIPNLDLEFERIVKENDETLLAQIETASDEHDAEEQIKNFKESKKLLGRNAREACEGILDIVRGYIIYNGFNSADKSKLKTDLKDIFLFATDCEPLEIKTALSSITVDGVIVTSELINEINEELTNKGF